MWGDPWFGHHSSQASLCCCSHSSGTAQELSHRQQAFSRGTLSFGEKFVTCVAMKNATTLGHGAERVLDLLSYSQWCNLRIYLART